MRIESFTCSKTISPWSLAYTRISGSLTTTRSLMGPPVSFRDEIGTRFVVEKLGDVVSENELEIADGTVALLGDDDFRDALLLGVFVVELVAIDERHQVGVLLDRSRFAKVCELGTMIAGALLRPAR